MCAFTVASHASVLAFLAGTLSVQRDTRTMVSCGCANIFEKGHRSEAILLKATPSVYFFRVKLITEMPQCHSALLFSSYILGFGKVATAAIAKGLRACLPWSRNFIAKIFFFRFSDPRCD